MNLRFLLSSFLVLALASGCTKSDSGSGSSSGGGTSTSSGGGNSGGVPGTTNPSSAGQLTGICKVNRIYGGDACPAAVGPVVLLLGVNSAGVTEYQCTGTFITTRHILTAAHCDPATEGQGLTLVAITSGNFRGTVPNILRGDTSTGVKVSQFIQHPRAQPDELVASYDVGIAVLAKPVLFAATVPLLTSEATQPGQSASIYGFGLEENQRPSVSNGQSALAPDGGDVTVAEVSQTEVVFGSKSDGSCAGDSGGPAMRQSAQGEVGIIGVTSGGFTEACHPATLSPAEFTSIAQGRLSPQEIAKIIDQNPNGIPQDFYVNTQDPTIVNFILSQAPGTEQR